MTEKQDREIELRELAKKFAGGDKARAREWLKTLRQAVKEGTLKAREERVSTPGVVRKVGSLFASREWYRPGYPTVGHTTFAGLPARVVAPTGRQALYESLTYVYHYVTPAAVAAWLHATVPDFEPPALVRAWLGADWQAAPKPEPRKKAKRQTERRDRLRVAMEAGLIAYRERHKTEPTAGDLFEWLGPHDETGAVTEYTEEFLWWKPSEGPEKKIDRKAFAKRMTNIRANPPR